MVCRCSSVRALSRTRWSRQGLKPSTIFSRYVTTTALEEANASFAQQLEEMKTRQLPVNEGLWDVFNIAALRKSLQSHLSLPNPFPNIVPPGYHQVSFNSLPHEHELAHDGAEQRHEPNHDWKFRVWVGGFLEFSKPYLWTDGPSLVAVDERITDARLIGDLTHENSRVIVTLTRTLFKPSLGSRGEPVYAPTGKLSIARAKDNILIKEEKHLCFMRNIPPSLTSPSQRRIAPPADPIFSQGMLPSPTLLFRFSALTRNAHAIHLDANYARQVYGLPKPLVHGPLTSVLMLDILGQALALHSIEADCAYVVRTLEYKNLQPIFVNEHITIACKRLHDVQPQGRKFMPRLGKKWEKWDVWIQKGAGKHASLSVRGSAWVSPVDPVRPREYPREEIDPSEAQPLF